MFFFGGGLDKVFGEGNGWGVASTVVIFFIGSVIYERGERIFDGDWAIL